MKESISDHVDCPHCGQRFPLTAEKSDDDKFNARVVSAVVADLKANGPIQMAIVGVFPPDPQ